MTAKEKRDVLKQVNCIQRILRDMVNLLKKISSGLRQLSWLYKPLMILLSFLKQFSGELCVGEALLMMPF